MILDQQYPGPFFDRSNETGRERSLLLLTYHFPPSRAVGALRWQKFANYVAERGWALDVITLDPSSIENLDDDRLRELPPGIRLFGVPEARSRVHSLVRPLLATRRAWLRTVQGLRGSGRTSANVRQQITSPRADSFSSAEIEALPLTPRQCVREYTAWLELSTMGKWARGAAKLALLLAKARRYGGIITCGPPHPVHEAGRHVAVRMGIPLIVDFRDPWSLVERVPEALASRSWVRRAARAEHNVLNTASLIVVNTEPHALALRRLYPALKAPLITVTNGYDNESFVSHDRSNRFVIAYAGTIYLDRDPRPIFRAVATVVRQLNLTPDDLTLAFMGSDAFGGASLRDMAAAENISSFLDVLPSGPRKDALQFLAGATMLVSLPQDSNMAIPAKVFEYMQYRAWLLALAAPESATAMLLRESPADVVDRNDIESLTRVIRTRIEDYRNGALPPRLADDPRFSRQRQAEILLDAIDDVMHSPGVVHASAPSGAVAV